MKCIKQKYLCILPGEKQADEPAGRTALEAGGAPQPGHLISFSSVVLCFRAEGWGDCADGSGEARTEGGN